MGWITVAFIHLPPKAENSVLFLACSSNFVHVSVPTHWNVSQQFTATTGWGPEVSGEFMVWFSLMSYSSIFLSLSRTFSIIKTLVLEPVPATQLVNSPVLLERDNQAMLTPNARYTHVFIMTPSASRMWIVRSLGVDWVLPRASTCLSVTSSSI